MHRGNVNQPAAPASWERLVGRCLGLVRAADVDALRTVQEVPWASNSTSHCAAEKASITSSTWATACLQSELTENSMLLFQKADEILQTAQRLLQQFLCSTDLRSEINDFTDFSETHHSSREEAPQLAQGLARHTSHIPSRPREMSCRVLPVFPDLQGHPRNPLALRPALKPARSCWH